MGKCDIMEPMVKMIEKWRDERTVEKIGDDVSMGKCLVLRAIFISGESINI